MEIDLLVYLSCVGVNFEMIIKLHRRWAHFLLAKHQKQQYLVPGNKGKSWADQFMVCLIAIGTQSTYVDSPRALLLGS